MEQQVQYCATSDGVRIAYASAGGGPLLIIVPGWLFPPPLHMGGACEGVLGAARETPLRRAVRRARDGPK